MRCCALPTFNGQNFKYPGTMINEARRNHSHLPVQNNRIPKSIPVRLVLATKYRGFREHCGAVRLQLVKNPNQRHRTASITKVNTGNHLPILNPLTPYLQVITFGSARCLELMLTLLICSLMHFTLPAYLTVSSNQYLHVSGSPANSLNSYPYQSSPRLIQ